VGQWVPGIASPGAYAIVGMAACFAAMTHAPMTAILILFEMTYDYGIILPVMTATVLAVMVSHGLRPETVYAVELKRRGIVLRRRVSSEILDQIRVAEAMSSPVQTMEENETLEDITQRIEHSPHTGFPVVNAQGFLVGLITYNELHQALENQTLGYRKLILAREIMREKPPRVFPQDGLHDAMELMERQQVDRLPVVDPDDPKRLLGILTKGDIALTFHKALNNR
jgi:CIC family chloride channel protein